MQRPARRPCRRDRWKAAVTKTPSLHAATRLFLTNTLVAHMKADGKVCYPRKRLAAEAGITERAVSRHVQRAREVGWLVVVSPGYRTSTAEYQASFPDVGKGDGHVTLSNDQKGDGTKHPLWVTEASPFPEAAERGKGDGSVTPLVVVTTTGETICIGDAHTCPCDECAAWRYAVDGLVAGMQRLNGLELDSSKAKKPRPLRAVGGER